MGYRGLGGHVVPGGFRRAASETRRRFSMQTLRAMTVAALAVLLIPLFSSRAHAHPGFGVPAGTATAQCVVGCNMQKKGCIQSARTTALACKQNCRATSAPTAIGSCARGCMTTFLSSVTTCRTDQKTCLAGCVPSGPPSGPPPTPSSSDVSCLGTCGMDLAGCAQGVVSQAKTCITGCRTATDRLTCFQGCATSATSGAQTCATDFQTCRSSGCPAS
jgi:hypothetical protein